MFQSVAKKWKQISLVTVWLKPDSVDLYGLVKNMAPLICKHFPFLELSSVDVKQIIASAPRSFADFEGFFSI